MAETTGGRQSVTDHVPSELQIRLLEAASPELELSFRPMFGGIMGYASGRAFASLSNVGLALKLAGADHAALLALPGAVPLRYERDSPPSKSYVVVPRNVLHDPDQLGGWAARSARAVAAAPKAVRKTRKPTPGDHPISG